jgi:hypothetical protein
MRHFRTLDHWLKADIPHGATQGAGHLASILQCLDLMLTWLYPASVRDVDANRREGRAKLRRNKLR